MYNSLAFALSFPQFCVDKSQSRSQIMSPALSYRLNFHVWSAPVAASRRLPQSLRTGPSSPADATHCTEAARSLFASTGHDRRCTTKWYNCQSVLLFHQNDWCTQCTSGYHKAEIYPLRIAESVIMRRNNLSYDLMRTGLDWICNG